MTRGGATSGAGDFTASEAVAMATGLGPVRHVATTGSTNSDLVVEARGGATEPCVLVADHQTAGRGRLDRQWEDEPGRSLLVSLRVPTRPTEAFEVMAAVGAGARAAVDALVPATVRVKWPNDLVVTDGPRPGKLAGVLAELVDGPTPVMVVGVGCNLAPVGSQPGSTSLEECGSTLGRDDVLAAILRAVAERFGSPERVHEEMQRHSSTLDSRVRVERTGAAPLLGTAVDLKRDGRLVVVDDAGDSHVIGAGDVITVRTDD